MSKAKVFKWPKAPPIKYAGLWIAWNKELTKVIASGKTFKEVVDAAEKKNQSDPLFEKVPHSRFVGPHAISL